MPSTNKQQVVYQGSTLTAVAFADALATFYFGPPDVHNRFGRYIWRAYRDVNRTIQGAGRLDESARTKRDARCEDVITKRLHLLAEGSVERSIEGFDRWHRESCNLLRKAHASTTGMALTVGQAQKWINMTLKYAYVVEALGVTPTLALRNYYRFAHMPIDNVVLDALRTMDPPGPSFPRPWSKQDDYDSYLAFQRAVRERFGCGLDAEFIAWHPRMENWADASQ